MPESPDFEQIADRLVVIHAPFGASRAAIAEQLRLVWNARGAADIAKLDALDVLEHGDTYIKIFDRALRRLDR
jgi:hypothetical protein